MNKLSVWLLALVVLLGWQGAALAASFEEGVDYEVLEQPGKVEVPGKTEVREFFWYGCPHCFQLEGSLESWAKQLGADVNFVRTPAPMNDNWVSHAHAFYVADSLGKLGSIGPALFNALHVKKEQVFSQEELARFFAGHGVDEKDFNKRYNSFAVRTKVRQARALSQQYRLRGVPAFVVNGKYLVKGKQGTAPDYMLKVVDFLVNKERVTGSLMQQLGK